MSRLTIALSKGRILKDTLPLLREAGIELLEDPEKSRKLIFPTTHPEVQIVIIRATDVPTYVENGAADLGVAGKDVLMEHGAAGVYEPLDLDIAKCRLMVAGPIHAPRVDGRLRVATKFVNLTRQFYAAKGEQVEVIKLYGSMELAPLMGLADRIVDVVDTGKTLKENGLEPMELIAHVSSRLIVNKASFKRKADLVQPLIQQLSDAVSRKRVS
ncbi:ATP phosphoribosyltransferase (homohexameric) [Fluviicoccus keumensis]|uniref:ATP phosphoribosyltransferase n=1 Tax=Fluviicoccus keumensis TaxID=1435465 RepID=A0A4Q7YDF3_9GAMM|nr:ATP phosphoribosyltransferase [Fluviicoccus keumensis]RZU35342.1 ATP phosphoribosyltransferase (homohexameric) [Fluviicoccus keumensis]